MSPLLSEFSPLSLILSVSDDIASVTAAAWRYGIISDVDLIEIVHDSSMADP